MESAGSSGSDEAFNLRVWARGRASPVRGRFAPLNLRLAQNCPSTSIRNINIDLGVSFHGHGRLYSTKVAHVRPFEAELVVNDYNFMYIQNKSS